jgi:hypothetical protein
MKKIYFLFLAGLSYSPYINCQNIDLNESLPNFHAIIKKLEKRNNETEQRISQLLRKDYRKIIKTDNKLYNKFKGLDSSKLNLLNIGKLEEENFSQLQATIASNLTEQQERLQLIFTYFEKQNLLKNELPIKTNHDVFKKQILNNEKTGIIGNKKQLIKDRFDLWNELLPTNKHSLMRLNKLNVRLHNKLKNIQFKNTLLSKAESKLLEKVPDIPGFENQFLAQSAWANIFQLNKTVHTENLLNEQLQTLAQNNDLLHHIQQLQHTVRSNELIENEQTEIKNEIQQPNIATDKVNNNTSERKIKSDKTAANSKTEIRFRPDLQINRTGNLLPAISQIGLSLLIKPSGKKWEIGQSFVTMAGWPGGNHNHFSVEGIGYRSFFEWPLLKQTRLYTGVELSLFTRLIPEGQLKNWHQYMVGSGLVGLNRIMQIGKQRFDMLVAYDLWYRQNPIQTSPWIVRTGINLFNKQQ